ncbi:MAG: hypothetical protein IH897_04585 [Planctomycetes bacterium]|nr:hypothetical protein [Planctomycetota bacterium]
MKFVRSAVVMLGLAYSSATMGATPINVWVEATDFGSSSATVGTTCGTLNYRVLAELGDSANQGIALIGFDLEFDGGSLDPASSPVDGSMDSMKKPDGLTNPAGYGGTPDSGKLLQVGGGANTIMNGQVPCTGDADCPGTSCIGGVCDPVAAFPVGTVVIGIGLPGSPQVVAEGVLNIPDVAGVYTLAATNVFANVITADTTGVPFCATEAATPGANTPLTLTVEVGAACGGQEIVDAVPPNGAIDAREPHLISDATVVSGWDSIELIMSTVSVTASVSDFSLSEVGGDGTPPLIIGASVIAATSIRLDFDAPIEPGAWTVVTHNASGSSTCLGFLPADAGQDRLASAGDINALINSINLVPGFILPDYATDINRSGVTNGQDILRLIDLLNGADEFAPWIAQTLPDNPCP